MQILQKMLAFAFTVLTNILISLNTKPTAIQAHKTQPKATAPALLLPSLQEVPQSAQSRLPYHQLPAGFPTAVFPRRKPQVGASPVQLPRLERLPPHFSDVFP